MNAFVAKHRSKINGVLECFDRVILRGHLPMASCDYFAVWLRSKQIALNLKHREPGWWTFKEAAPWFAETFKTHAAQSPPTQGALTSTCRHTSRWRNRPASWPERTTSPTV